LTKLLSSSIHLNLVPTDFYRIPDCSMMICLVVLCPYMSTSNCCICVCVFRDRKHRYFLCSNGLESNKLQGSEQTEDTVIQLKSSQEGRP